MTIEMTNAKNLLFVLLLFSCMSNRNGRTIKWVESNAICVHWSDVGKEKYDTKAIRIVLRSSDLKMFESKSFYFRTKVMEEASFLLGKVDEIKREGDDFLLFLFIRSEDLYDLFPEGKNYYNDDCYHIELANMIGQGKVLMEAGKIEVEIGKSEGYSFHVGPK